MVTSTAAYRETELGQLPQDWQVAELGDLFSIQQGKALSPKAREGKSPAPFLRTSNVLWGRLDLSSLDEMDFTEEQLERLSLEPRDLLVCEGGEVGRTAIWHGEVERCSYQNHLHRLRVRNSQVCPEFYMYWMQAALLLLNLYVGAANRTTIANLSKSRLSKFRVPVPPLPEQRRIAAVLGTVQEAKERTEAVIQAAKELKKSLLKYLFTYGPVPVDEAENVPLRETEAGVAPTDWQVAPLGDLLENTQYGLSVKGRGTGQYPMLRMANMADGHVTTRDLQYVDLDDAEFEKYRLNPGDLLFNRTNSFELVGKTALFDSDDAFVFASYLIRVALDREQVLPEYMNYYLNAASTQTRLKMLATRGVSQSNISATKLKNLPVAIPASTIQRQIVKVLAALDDKTRGEQDRGKAFGELFSTLLHDLMTARVRVRDLDLPADLSD